MTIKGYPTILAIDTTTITTPIHTSSLQPAAPQSKKQWWRETRLEGDEKKINEFIENNFLDRLRKRAQVLTTHTCIHKCLHTNINASIHTYTCCSRIIFTKYIHSYIHTIHTYILTHTLIHTVHTMHTYVNAYIHPYIHS